MSLDALFQKLVSLWQSKIDEAYSVYSNFIKLKKIEMSMNDYIIEYEHLYQKKWLNIWTARRYNISEDNHNWDQHWLIT